MTAPVAPVLLTAADAQTIATIFSDDADPFTVLTGQEIETLFIKLRSIAEGRTVVVSAPVAPHPDAEWTMDYGGGPAPGEGTTEGPTNQFSGPNDDGGTV